MYSGEIRASSMLNTQDKNEMIKTVKFRLYFKTVIRQNEDGFEINSKYFRFNHILLFIWSIKFTRCISSEYILFSIFKNYYPVKIKVFYIDNKTG